MSSPSAVTVYPYQQRWIDETSTLAIYNKARQIGITWATMLGLVLRCAAKKEKWYFLSCSERQAQEAMEYASLFCAAIQLAGAIEDRQVLIEGYHERQLGITFPSGSQLVGLPANPRTARGCSGNVVLDEFAHHLDAQKIWQALYPVVTRGYMLRVLSTPAGKQGKFWDLWSEGRQWSRHETDIYEAQRQGFSVNLDLLRDGCGCEEDWRQEYCCEFLDETSAWLPYDLIERAYHEEATLEFLPGATPVIGDLWLGVDVARKQDVTVLWLLEQQEDIFITRAVRTLRTATFAQQRASIEEILPYVRRCCIDSNSVGAQLAEELRERWGSIVEGVAINGRIPGMLATKTKDAFERGLIQIPNDPDIRKDLHSIRKVYTVAGNVRFEAPRTRDGHADRFWALSLALWAADATICASPDYETVEPGRWNHSATRPTMDQLDGSDRWRGYN